MRIINFLITIIIIIGCIKPHDGGQRPVKHKAMLDTISKQYKVLKYTTHRLWPRAA